jgi:hypothetical protein
LIKTNHFEHKESGNPGSTLYARKQTVPPFATPHGIGEKVYVVRFCYRAPRSNGVIFGAA